MKEFLERILHTNIKVKEASSLYKELPLLYRGSYTIYTVDSDGVLWLAMQPRSDIRLNQLRQNRNYLEKTKKMNVALFLRSTSLYSKDKMIEDGIPFVISDDSVYLPFLGILLGKKQRELKPVHQISFLTQRILLSGLYESYNMATVTFISEHLNVSKMAVSKCFDEIDYLGLDVLIHDKKRRYITMNQDKQNAWERIRPYLRNPVIKVINLRDDMRLERKAGISALSEYSMLADNNFPTYAVEKNELKDKGIGIRKQALRTEEIGCRVLEVGYFIDCVKKNIQDPLSVLLSIEDESDDERVEQSIEKMLKDFVW